MYAYNRLALEVSIIVKKILFQIYCPEPVLASDRFSHENLQQCPFPLQARRLLASASCWKRTWPSHWLPGQHYINLIVIRIPLFVEHTIASESNLNLP
eukprot:COSAG06_NODE_295_length_18175_cov_9.088017_15_plen_98_part_00